MAERYRSKDGLRETDRLSDDQSEGPVQGRSGGNLARKIGTRDEKKRATERPAGATRVEGKDERESQLKENI